MARDAIPPVPPKTAKNRVSGVSPAHLRCGYQNRQCLQAFRSCFGVHPVWRLRDCGETPGELRLPAGHRQPKSLSVQPGSKRWLWLSKCGQNAQPALPFRGNFNPERRLRQENLRCVYGEYPVQWPPLHNYK